MPTYAYECQDCRYGFEIVQRMSDDALTTCESCGGTLKKKMFPVGIAFKGSGFYVNDYAAKRESTAASTTAATATDTTTSDNPAKTDVAAATAPAKSEVKSEPAAKPAATTATV